MKTPAQTLSALDADLSSLESHAKWLAIKSKIHQLSSAFVKPITSRNAKASEELRRIIEQQIETLELLYQNKIDFNTALERIKTTTIIPKEIAELKKDQQIKEEFEKIDQENSALTKELEDPSIWPSKTLYDQYWSIDAALGELSQAT